MKKRFLSLALSAVLALSVLTPAALAAEYVEIVPPKYDEIGDFSDGLAAVKLDGKWGFIDATGKEVLPLKYDGAGFFSDGVAVVRQGQGAESQRFAIDKTGKELFKVNYGGFYGFVQGVAIVSSGGNSRMEPLQYGLIDKTGKEIIPPKYDHIYDFSEGLAMVQVVSGFREKYGFIDATGKEVVPPIYDYAKSFAGGVAKVGAGPDGNNKYGFIDTTGKEVIPLQHSSSISFSEGLAAVYSDGKWGYVDTTGRQVIPFQLQYNSVGNFSDGLARVSVGKYTDAKHGYIDATGKEVVPPKYDIAYDFSEGLAAVRLDGKWGYIDKTGKEVISFNNPDQYIELGPFSEGMAKVSCLGRDYDERFGYIDTTGKEVIPCKYYDTEPISGGFLLVDLDYKYIVVDTNGRVIVPYQYRSISTTNVDGLMKVSDENRKYGLIRLSTTTPAPTVPPSPCAVTLDGKAITLNAYLFTENGGGSNYVMLRDIAMLLNGTEAQFDVSWSADTGISITKGNAYTPVGGELQSKGTGEKGYTANSSTITVDGKLVSLGGYTIESNNYFKLRDLGNALGFTVDWDAATGTVVLSTNG